ncbi:hypothetical protein [Euryhalocaulis caribicus]|uniref:hypothetical protein n=1 Tax=Euryhalocaulis caribicus TaxID=1161401 RepID=UPI0003B52460|nr:hypothetical protein [Euryhalocaulis caribicus]
MNEPQGSVPIIQTVQAAYGFFVSHWLRAVPAALIAGLAGAVLAYPSMAAPGSITPGLAFLSLVAGLAGFVVYQAALYRLALRPEDAGQFGVSFGSDELRLAGVIAALGLFVILVAIVAIFPLMLVVMSVAASDVGLEAIESASIGADTNFISLLGPAAGTIYIIGMIAIVALVVWVNVRLSLAMAATIAERRFVLLAAWGWTKGSALRIFAALVLALLPLFLPLVLVQSLLAPQIAAAGTGAVIVSFVIQFISSATMGVVGAGLYAYLYKGLRPPRETA